MPQDVPLEYDEQVSFVKWLEQKSLKFTAIPNDTYTKSWAQKAKKKAEGLRAGFPDMIVLVSPDKSIDGLGKFICIEMKRQKSTPSAVKPHQREWLEAIEETNVTAQVCKGAKEAIELINGYLI